MNQNWLNDQRLLNLPWDKRTLLINWLNENQNKRQDELIPAVLALNTILKQKNLSFSREEQQLLLEIISDNMTPNEQQHLAMLKTFMHF